MFHFSGSKVGTGFVHRSLMRVHCDKRTGGNFRLVYSANGGQTAFIMGAHALPGYRILIWPLQFFGIINLVQLVFTFDFQKRFLPLHLPVDTRSCALAASFQKHRLTIWVWFFLHRPFFRPKSNFFEGGFREYELGPNSKFSCHFCRGGITVYSKICRLFQEAKGFLLCFLAYQSSTTIYPDPCAVLGKSCFL